ncbi:hypothetical protein BBK14_11165 [Parafrankia soli]|uniref:Uncharacterized protein n=1 Tax=Parafrankia soli TaxID=2599596 RepID=A0A1S1RBM4_9ACTN|nr:hypothetical protein [Parafrankia soli]OHV42174.1 hypothetical protein BBK14_11165 [Parafrankia soli]
MAAPWWREADDWSAGRRQTWSEAGEPAPRWMRAQGRRPAESAAARLRFWAGLVLGLAVSGGLLWWSLRTGG